MILGAAGNFGTKISWALAKLRCDLILCGRNRSRLNKFVHKIKFDEAFVNHKIAIDSAAFDIRKKSALAENLSKFKPKVLIDTCGPFQARDYNIAKTCIEHGVHYIDLADGRDFVTGINVLDKDAKAAGVSIISGASTVPGLSSCVLEKYKDSFSQIDSMEFGISPGQKAQRGLATTQAILSYLGKPLKKFESFNKSKKVYGWQGVYRQSYPVLGKRWMANCDIPDLDLLPKKYGIKNIKFCAGMESGMLHLGMWFLSWIVRCGAPIKLPKYAKLLLKLSHVFDFLGSDDGGMHIILKGKDKNGKPKEIKWFLIAKGGDGPQVPTIPAILLAKKLNYLSESQLKNSNLIGAQACVGLVSLDEYLDQLSEFDVKIYT